jgi:hypothetical protein
VAAIRIKQRRHHRLSGAWPLAAAAEVAAEISEVVPAALVVDRAADQVVAALVAAAALVAVVQVVAAVRVAAVRVAAVRVAAVRVAVVRVVVVRVAEAAAAAQLQS